MLISFHLVWSLDYEYSDLNESSPTVFRLEPKDVTVGSAGINSDLSTSNIRWGDQAGDSKTSCNQLENVMLFSFWSFFFVFVFVFRALTGGVLFVICGCVQAFPILFFFSFLILKCVSLVMDRDMWRTRYYMYNRRISSLDYKLREDNTK